MLMSVGVWPFGLVRCKPPPSDRPVSWWLVQGSPCTSRDPDSAQRLRDHARHRCRDHLTRRHQHHRCRLRGSARAGGLAASASRREHAGASGRCASDGRRGPPADNRSDKISPFSRRWPAGRLDSWYLLPDGCLRAPFRRPRASRPEIVDFRSLQHVMDHSRFDARVAHDSHQTLY